MTPFSQDDKKKMLRNLIERLHKGADPEVLKKEFREVFGVTGTDIALLEQDLIKEGLPREDVHRLCDIHLSLLRDSIEKEKLDTPSGHPIHILMEEHRVITEFVNERRDIAKEIAKEKNHDSIKEKMDRLKDIRKSLDTAEKHYQREENVLFPYLEKHGITEPPAIMWMDHNKIRELKKSMQHLMTTYESVEFKKFNKHLEELATTISETVTNHFYKENNILFPTSLRVITENEWPDIRQQFDEIGYCEFTPKSATVPMKEKHVITAERGVQDEIVFETGSMSREEIESTLNNMPIDITFIGKDDTVRYFSQSEERIFVRTKAVIGRQVQQCHPQKSLHVVNQILDDFKNDKRNVAEFWINLNDRLIYIRYFPVRNKKGEYLGCLEVTQDITDIKKIEGEKRLLD